LECLGVPYFIGGSLTTSLYGMVRTTKDSDIIADPRIEHISPLIAELQSKFYMDDEMIADAILHQSGSNIIHRESMY
jgi:hypothetical protein